ncbi:MAG TPA: macro domain-containing protein [Acidobacteriota bacterium]|jgi:O-acetyl-ADP-ribose deacetylase (regulator of RNase III)|nr:macro domain-containing protein [Acidobacteriota bacterium]
MATAEVETEQIQLIKGDITLLEVDAFVFYAQPDLELGSGFGTAISIRGGPAVKKELEGLGPVETGEAVVSGAGNLRASHIIHAVGPRFLEENTEEKLKKTILSSLRCAEEAGAETIAFPPMGTGFYGISLDLCSRLLVEVVSAHLKTSANLKKAIICVQDSKEYEPFRKELSKVTG